MAAEGRELPPNLQALVDSLTVERFTHHSEPADRTNGDGPTAQWVAYQLIAEIPDDEAPHLRVVRDEGAA